MNPADFREPKREPKLEPGTESKPPLMTQNGGAAAGMMMHQTPMYPAGYQMPPGYPSAPSTPGPLGSAPPPTMMYPSAPTPSLMQPNYSHGFASGSSTPVNSNARSPARSRKAQQGLDNASAWLGHQHPHLAPPGTPGPGSPYGSRAPSVMSGMSMMTGINDDAMSVMSGVSLVELQPVASHQENIDPARQGAMLEEVRNLALRLTPQQGQTMDQPIQALRVLYDRIKQANCERFPKDVLELLIARTLEALCTFANARLDQARLVETMGRIFFILHALANISSQIRTDIVRCCLANYVPNPPAAPIPMFDYVMNIVFHFMSNLYPHGLYTFRCAVCFLNSLVREDRSDHTMHIMRVIGPNKELFSSIFKLMINTQVPTSIEFVCRYLRLGDRRAFREKIYEEKVEMLLHGKLKHEGLLKRCLRKNESVHNTLKIIDILVRNDSEQTPHEILIQKWFIEKQLFDLLPDCIRTADPKLVAASVTIYASLAGSPYITDETAEKLTQQMLGPHCLSRTDMNTQGAIMYTLYNVCTKRVALQLHIMDQHALNYSCHLIKSWANGAKIANPTKNYVLDISLDSCYRLLQLPYGPEDIQRLWAPDEQSVTKIFFEAEFAACLLNVLDCPEINVQLKTKAIQIMAAGLSLPAPVSDRFASSLYNAVDENNRNNVVTCVFNAVVTTLMPLSINAAGAALLRAAADLLVHIVAERPRPEPMPQPAPTVQLTALAKSNNAGFPLSILFCPATNSGERMIDSDERTVKKILLVSKKLIEDPEIQQAWARYRDTFTTLSNSGNYEISPLATDILSMLGTEGDNDFSLASVVTNF